MPPRNDYERGKRNGKTEATLNSLADSLDRIEDALEKLPCVAHENLLGRYGLWLKLEWALLLTILGGMAGLLWKTIGKGG